MDARREELGFSLLEILVVLAIMSILLSIGGSYMLGTMASVRFSQTSDAAISDILLYRHEAYVQGKEYYVVNHENDLQDLRSAEIVKLNVPEGWKVSGDIIYISSRGLCMDGTLNVEDTEGRSANYKILFPLCKISKM